MLIDQIKSLEAKAATLEPQESERDLINKSVFDHLNNFLEALEESPAYNPNLGQSKSNTFSDDGITIDEAIHEGLDIDRLGINPASGYHLGYVPGGGIYTSALGDFWAAVTNRYAGVFYANPGSVRIENELIQWMCQLVGYDPQAGGNLTSGGSIANLTAIVVARDTVGVNSTNIEKKVLYMTEQAHHCVDKALRIAGLSEIAIRRVNMDTQYRMDSQDLERLIEADKLAGFEPWMVVASCGTTDTGAIDPLLDIGNICKSQNIWYHIDAAYGGFFLLTKEGKARMEGINLADSVVMDPHKSMFLPYGSGVVLFKSRNSAVEVLRYSANYMQDVIEDDEQTSPADISLELTKHFRGMRFWLPLKIHGIGPFRAALEEKILLARYVSQQLENIDGIKIGPYPDLSIVTFRYFSTDHSEERNNTFNQMILDYFHQDGQVYISSTRIDGILILRFAILVFRTHLHHVNIALKTLKKAIQDLEV